MRGVPVFLCALLVGAACGPAPRAATPPPAAGPVTGPTARPAPPAPDAATPPTEAASTPTTPDAGTPGLITDEECVARGGHVETEQTYPSERPRSPGMQVHPFRVCRVPSPQNGNDCQGDSDCGRGRCFCTGELSGPDVTRRRPDLRARDGTPATGRCSDGHLPSGAWFCLVENGRVVVSGIIID